MACAGGTIGEDEPAVCLVTGHGFKDPDSIAAAADRFPANLVIPEELEDALA
jgi:threonine synthase